ncbi:RNA dependent RNA polymerase-domain-containing protein [Kalaharituber pfeilii]|nr:RNA dependent RNA polymerase-domain-containing protein [Kalaharituber pfeilii]
MELFMTNVPGGVNERVAKSQLQQPLRALGIRAFDVFIFKKGGKGTLLVPTAELGQRLLAMYGAPGRQTGNPQGPVLRIKGQPIRLVPSKRPADKHAVEAIYRAHNQIIAEESRTSSEMTHQDKERRFDVEGVECGTWTIKEEPNCSPLFNSYYKLERRGKMIFGRDGVRVTIFDSDGSSSEIEPEINYVIFISYYSIESIIVSSHGRPHATFTLNIAPRFYRNIEATGLLDLISQLSLDRSTAIALRSRVSSLDQEHAIFSAFCFTYRFHLQSPAAVRNLQQLGKHKGIPEIDTLLTTYAFGYDSFIKGFLYLMGEINYYEFAVAFQLTILLANGALPPQNIINLLPNFNSLINTFGSAETAVILQDFISIIPKQNPLDRRTAHADKQLQESLEECVRRYRRLKSQKFGLQNAREDDGNLASVRHAYITPAGCYFDGPKPETQNRVLRKYSDFHDYFLRVTFTEEDGDSLSYERDVSQDLIYKRFKNYMLESAGQGGNLIIGGRVFSFLGFSGASLRNHTCWFMAPFNYKGQLIDSTALIATLGDFSHIRTPGKCAARIGQAFSNTFNSVFVPPESEQRVPDVERNGRCFSDGCGTISTAMMQRIWTEAPLIARSKPFVFQIRFAGAKGVVSLDTRLTGDVLRLRPSMVKFNGSDSRNIEICSSANKPLPMFLNRPLIKILEDLGVEASTFMELQEEEVRKLRQACRTPALAANFMERRSIGIKALKLPWLVKTLHSLGVSFQEDSFLGQAFELALLTALRDIKYRSRIQIPEGFTVMGLMDETGELEEGEIFCHIDSDGVRKVLKGQIVITRAPAMHPGDVQVCRAVDVRPGSPLLALRNCVVFSQKGDRDLPSQLSGGDLDGDLYNLIFDPRFRPRIISAPANYPRVTGLDLGRPVTTADMVAFLIDFMQNDRLGLISHRHLIIADQQPEGVFHPDCLKLAEMHSTAVDFPKTGIKVEMSELPKCGRARPDFMAPGPHLLVDRLVNRYEEERDARDGEEDGDEYGHLPTRYYESQKILGKLYRAIDEREFVSEVHSETRRQNLILDVWDYIVTFVTDKDYPLTVPWRAYKEFAEELKESYEDEVRSMMRNFSTTPSAEPLREVEVFIGSIVGKGKQNRREKDSSMAMKDEFDRLVEETINCIQGVDDEAGTGDPLDTLGRGMACLWECVNNDSEHVRRHGEEKLRSFAWVAASAVLSEVNELQKRRNQPQARRAMRTRTGLPAPTSFPEVGRFGGYN